MNLKSIPVIQVGTTRLVTFLSSDRLYKYFGEDLYGLVHVAGWELYDLVDLAHDSGVGSVLDIYRSSIHIITVAVGSTL